MIISTRTALEKLDTVPSEFKELFTHGTLSLEVYKPEKIDRQQPHERDEVYVVIAGSGKFRLEDDVKPFTAGDFIFVPAQAEHRFEDFTDDFSTWVIFYGPDGGESP